jgi:hypothetical protein
MASQFLTSAKDEGVVSFMPRLLYPSERPSPVSIAFEAECVNLVWMMCSGEKSLAPAQNLILTVQPLACRHTD